MNKFLFSKSSVYHENYYLYQYNDNNFRVVKLKNSRSPGFEDTKPKKNEFIKQTEDEEVQRVSLSRTRRNVRELALCNGFEFFATLTVNSERCDRFSLTETQALMRKKLKKLKRKNSDFAYLFITEKHKNGAFHFHGLVKGVSDFYVNSNGYLSHLVFDELGFNSFSKIKNYDKCCNYITKYITKDCVKNEAGTVYISSRGLKKADVYEIVPVDLKWNFKNDFCCISDFNSLNMSEEDLLKFCLISEKH